MAATAPIELPAGRRSYISPHPHQDVHDPGWIPILNAADLEKVAQFSEKEVSPYNQASFSPFPTRPDTPKAEKPDRSALSHTHNKTSAAPEHVPHELEADPLPPRTSSRKHARTTPTSPEPESQGLRNSSAPSTDGQETVASDGVADNSTAPSTTASNSMIEEQYFTLPGAPVDKEDILPPQFAQSTRSSMASTKSKMGVFPPTSKYNRKAVPSMVSVNRPPTIKSQPTTPQASPRIPPAMPASSISLPLDILPPLQAARPATPTSPAITPLPLQPAKSNASDRRQRALNSHPSNISLRNRSRANSTSDEAEQLPRPPSLRHKPRKSLDANSRPTTPRSTIYDAQTPTPAPTTPLPSLPREAFIRPSTREGQGLAIKSAQPPIEQPPQAHIASPPLPGSMRGSDHNEMASFMTSNSTVIFRRFDDVHVKLLLCLQDEISQLERDLLKLENNTSSSVDRNTQKMRIMRELRRVVAEYDHLFANWSQMQASKANSDVMKDLKQWLENPSTSAGAGFGISNSAKEDLHWLQSSKDLSSVRLGSPNNGGAASMKGSGGSTGGRIAGGGKASFGSLFASCAGKRK